jgi:2-polyprenyl-3-methyl-5-hydroxy-6-metoxy-1,4-benzoquinol methylase
MENISCIFCGKQSDHIAITENGYAGRKCQDCNLIYISPRPNAADVKYLYTDEHAVLYADAQFQFDKVKRMIAVSTLAKIRNYRKSGALLELGPGGGYFLQEARNWGYDPYGIELNPIEARWINEKLQIPSENVALNEGSFGGKQFDIIYHNDVLSHLYDPIGVFGDINRALKRDGLLVFKTGNIADVDEKYYKFFSQFLYPDHLFFYGEHSLKMLLERTGYKYICVYREAILLQLLLQKALWRFKDSLKDKRVIENMKTHKRIDSEDRGLSVKRQLRLMYQYVSHYFIRVGRILPKNGRPLKLLVVAEKKSDPRSP